MLFTGTSISDVLDYFASIHCIVLTLHVLYLIILGRHYVILFIASNWIQVHGLCCFLFFCFVLFFGVKFDRPSQNAACMCIRVLLYYYYYRRGQWK